MLAHIPSIDDLLETFFRTGDEAVFNLLVDRVRPQLEAFAEEYLGPMAYLGDPQAVVDDAMLIVYSREVHFEKKANNSGLAWLRSIVADRAFDAYRMVTAAKRGGGNINSIDENFDPVENGVQEPLNKPDFRERSPVDSAIITEARDHLRSYLDGLPPEQQAAVMLKLFGFSWQETADRTGISFGMVRSAYNQAIGSLSGVLGAGQQDA
jgi:RNA polymerase sigma factor (sigma-70 family)